jgi:hypothetical protein
MYLESTDAVSDDRVSSTSKQKFKPSLKGVTLTPSLTRITTMFKNEFVMYTNMSRWTFKNNSFKKYVRGIFNDSLIHFHPRPGRAESNQINSRSSACM